MAIPGQCLSLFAQAWKDAGADPALQDLVKNGHRIIFDGDPPPLSVPSPEFETKLPKHKMKVIREEISKLWHVILGQIE